MANERIQTRIGLLSNDLRAIADAMDSLGKDNDAKPESLDRLARMGVQAVAYAMKDLVYEMNVANQRETDRVKVIHNRRETDRGKGL